MNTELKPCPFCGGPATHVSIPTYADETNAGGEFIECIDCHASTAILFPTMDSILEALVERWNIRKTPSS